MSCPVAPVLDESFDNIIIIDGLPITEVEKRDKLAAVVTSKFAAYNPLSIEIPIDDATKKTKGFAFMTFEKAEQATNALTMNGKPFTKTQNFLVSQFASIDKIMQTPDEYNASEVDSPIVDNNEDSYRLDQDVRDQFLLRFFDPEQGHRTHINWIDPCSQNIFQQAHCGENSEGKTWTTQHTGFSVRGTYLYTIHAQGVLIRAGKDFDQISRIEHPNVAQIDFSPNEKYCVTMSYQDPSSPYCDVAVWLTKTGQNIVRYSNILVHLAWPLLRWSYDGRYFARTAFRKVETEEKGETKIIFEPFGLAIYDMDDGVKPLGGKPISVPGISQFEWSPTDPYIAFTASTDPQSPHRFVIYDVTQRKPIRTNRTFGVLQWLIKWQQNGESCVVWMSRKTDKSKQVEAIDMYMVHQREVPLIEHIIPKQYPVINFFIDPCNPYIMIQTAIDTSQRKSEFSLYHFTPSSARCVWEQTIPLSNSSSVNYDSLQAHFCPAGLSFVITSMTPAGLEWFPVDCSRTIPQQLMDSVMFPGGNYFSFDSTGRYFAIAATTPYPPTSNQIRRKEDSMNTRGTNGSTFAIFTFQGDHILDYRVPSLYSFAWRPNTSYLLTKEDKKQIDDELKTKWWKPFEDHDERFIRAKRQEAKAQRQAIRQAWKDLRAEHAKIYHENTAHRRQACYNDQYDSEDECEEYEDIVIDEDVVEVSLDEIPEDVKAQLGSLEEYQPTPE